VPFVTQPAHAEAVVLRDVEKVFASGTGEGPVHALRGVSLVIRDNEFFTLLGPSGCGKTTLLRLLAGFEHPTRGSLALFGTDLERLPPHRRPVNTVFQQYALFPHLTVARNVAFGPEMLGWGRAETDRAVAEALELVRMSALAERRPAEISGGQQQRIALARALAPRPRVLLLDEPLSALDLKLRQAMRLELKALQTKTGITFIFVTHDQEEALTMSDRIAVMSMGEVQQVGTPAEIYRQPANRFVAEFIGDTNLIPATVERVEAGTACCAVAGGLLSMPGMAGKRSGDAVTLALRPENIRLSVLSKPCPPPPDGSLAGRIVDRIYLGTDTAYRVAVGGDLVLTVRDQNHSFERCEYAIDAAVRLDPAPGSVRMLTD
jgi:spermidine/putrescine transport system ATP-binding protein